MSARRCSIADMGQSLPFTDDDLRRAAGPVSYARGLGYLDRVAELTVAGTWVTATVFGSDVYRVRLSFGDKRGEGMGGDCSCPFGAEGNFCKHCVATGLVALENGHAVHSPAGAASSADGSGLVAWLNSLSRDELLTELLQLLVDEPELCKRLESRAAAQRVDVEGVCGFPDEDS
jgi:uncharacterized Zn finger protein